MSKPRQKHAWEIARDAADAEKAEYVAMLRDGDDEYIVELAGQALERFHDAMMTGDDDMRRSNQLFIDACVETLFRVTQQGHSRERPDGSGGCSPATGRSRFGCIADAQRWLGAQLAAPDGQVPMHGQPGRFMVMVHGCRTDAHYGGLFGICALEGYVIDLDRPFFSETGYRSFTMGGGIWGEPRYVLDEPMEVDEFARLYMEASLLSDGNGKRLAEPKLHAPPFGKRYHKGGQSFFDADAWKERRANDPAWQKGGYLASLPALAQSGLQVREGKYGQLALIL